jgi:surfactin synthase thioesterase subunit
LVEKISQELSVELRSPFSFFGHSLGGMLAFELAHICERRFGLSPSVLFLSGVGAPGALDYSRYARPYSDAQLIEELRALKGTDREVFENPDLLELALPILRSDFQVCGSYTAQPGRPPLRCPIHVFGGSQDTRAGEPAGWSRETTGDFGCDVLPGDHFFIQPCEAQVLERVVQRLSSRRDLSESAPLVRL